MPVDTKNRDGEVIRVESSFYQTAREAWEAAREAHTGTARITPFDELEDRDELWDYDSPLYILSQLEDGSRSYEQEAASWGSREAGVAFVEVAKKHLSQEAVEEEERRKKFLKNLTSGIRHRFTRK